MGILFSRFSYYASGNYNYHAVLKANRDESLPDSTSDVVENTDTLHPFGDEPQKAAAVLPVSNEARPDSGGILLNEDISSESEELDATVETPKVGSHSIFGPRPHC